MASNPFDDALAALPPERFAVVDGALFDDLPALLAGEGLAGQALYLEGPDRAAVAAGPFLVDATRPAALAAILRLVRSKPAAVFWSWKGGKAALYRHLRGITTIDIPDGEGRTDVLFRLADPRALAIVLPVLTPEQCARFIGDAQAILFAREDGMPVVLSTPPQSHGTRGRIALSTAQYEAIEHAFDAQQRTRAVADFAPRLAGDSHARIGDAYDRAQRYGFDDMRAIWEFIAWDVAIGPRFEAHPQFAAVHHELTDPANAPPLRLFYARDALHEALAASRSA